MNEVVKALFLNVGAFGVSGFGTGQVCNFIKGEWIVRWVKAQRSANFGKDTMVITSMHI